MKAVERARREQLNAVPWTLADKKQKPVLLLPTVPKLLCSSVSGQDAVVLLPPRGSPLCTALAQPWGVSGFWRPLPGTKSPV